MELRVPGRVYDECFDPNASAVPQESDWPEPSTEKRGRGLTHIYEVTQEQRDDMIWHARTLMDCWASDCPEAANVIRAWLRRLGEWT